MSITKTLNGVKYKLIFTRYIKKNGRIIYPKNSKVFCFWVKA